MAPSINLKELNTVRGIDDVRINERTARVNPKVTGSL